MAKIRKAYATAKADAEKAKKGTDPVLGHMEVTSSHVEPGVGPQKETLQYFFRRTEDQTTGMFRYKPFLITRKYNIAAQDFSIVIRLPPTITFIRFVIIVWLPCR